jgi:hypothetical protein
MRARVWLFIVVVVVLLSPIAWYLGSPLFTNRVVDERFPATTGPAEQVSP